MNLAKYIDYTLLKATATPAQIEKLCQEARQYGFFSVCVNSSYVPLVALELKGSNVKVCTVVGFPLGAMSTQGKLHETSTALAEGADEIDMVINLGLLLSGQITKVRDEIALLKQETADKVLKVIIETCYLTDDQKRLAAQLCVDAGVDFVKTSTGFGTGGATLADVQLIKEVVGDNALIKASGGIRDRETALQYIALGASRIGASAILI
ncbi:deoxyribose-phosphate aldolase [Capnocytophaga sp. oral taxon 863 str. F0517]|uniref:deoxyribose-phosphate aldolase n=1 Tax=Capnocytophaga sp. oral taxon 863 TaxID=1227265 RepID=UPI000397C92C|nr:deoxyribose-phosphate aldolase [Capnocytophaga sp. oral taxon 863]ERI64726.1 deoxyribose-phosphate aldolase [Capnocytophaga sp. oral taxon 863 str. F0517]